MFKKNFIYMLGMKSGLALQGQYLGSVRDFSAWKELPFSQSGPIDKFIPLKDIGWFEEVCEMEISMSGSQYSEKLSRILK